MQKEAKTSSVKTIVLTLLMGLAFSQPARAQFNLENPQSGSTQSGISLVSGWKCSGGTITVQFDDWPPEIAAYGTSRPDTQGACGDTDNGFGDLFNFNRLGDGIHTVRLFDNGQLFASTTFVVQTLGQEFLQIGPGPLITIRGFPSAGKHFSSVWQESKQEFTITYFGVPTSLTSLLGSWNFTSWVGGNTVPYHYNLLLIQNPTFDTPLIIGHDVDHGHSVIAGRIQDIPLSFGVDPAALPWDFFLFDLDPTVCRFFLFNSTALNTIMGDELQFTAIGNSCETQNDTPLLRMAGVRTSFAMSAQEENPSGEQETPAPTDSEKKTFFFQPKEGEPLPIASQAVLRHLTEQLRTVSR